MRWFILVFVAFAAVGAAAWEPSRPWLAGIGAGLGVVNFILGRQQAATSRRIDADRLMDQAQRLLGLRLVKPFQLHRLKEVDPLEFDPLLRDARRLAPKHPRIDFLESFALAVQGKGKEAETKRQKVEDSGDSEWASWAVEAKDALKVINEMLPLFDGGWEELREGFEVCPYDPEDSKTAEKGKPLVLLHDDNGPRYYLAPFPVHNGAIIEELHGENNTWRPVRVEGMPDELRGYDGPDDDTGRKLDPRALYRWPTPEEQDP